MGPVQDVVVHHAPDRRRYELVAPAADAEVGAAAGQVVGFTEYRAYEGGAGPARVFFHTEVDGAFDGRGLASLLVTAALEDTLASGLRIVPVCPYVTAFLRRHHEYDAHVDPVTPDHLAVLP